MKRLERDWIGAAHILILIIIVIINIINIVIIIIIIVVFKCQLNYVNHSGTELVLIFYCRTFFSSCSVINMSKMFLLTRYFGFVLDSPLLTCKS